MVDRLEKVETEVRDNVSSVVNIVGRKGLKSSAAVCPTTIHPPGDGNT